MRLYWIIALTASCFPAFAELGHAQKCGGSGYSLSDRGVVFSVVRGRAVALLSRMHQLSVVSSAFQLSPEASEIINDEYQQLMVELGSLSETDSPKLRRRTEDWLKRITEASFLKLSGTQLTASDSQGAHENSATAAQKTYEATLTFLNCL